MYLFALFRWPFTQGLAEADPEEEADPVAAADLVEADPVVADPVEVLIWMEGLAAVLTWAVGLAVAVLAAGMEVVPVAALVEGQADQAEVLAEEWAVDQREALILTVLEVALLVTHPAVAGQVVDQVEDLEVE